MLTALLAALLVQDSYRLEFEWTPVEGSCVSESQSNESRMFMEIRQEGQVLQRREGSQAYRFAAEAEIEKVDKGRIMRERRTFSEAVRIGDGGAETALGFKGKTVIWERRPEGPPSILYEDGSAPGDADVEGVRQAFLGRATARDQETTGGHFAPRNPVKVGDSWSPDLKELARRMFQMTEFNEEKSSARFTLKAIEPRDGTEFARVEGVVELIVDRMGPITLDTPLTMKMTVELEAAVNGSSPEGRLSTTMEFKGKSEGRAEGGLVFSVEVDVRGKTGVIRKFSR